MTVPQTLRTWTAMKVVTSICGFGMLLLLQMFL
jgi:H+/gluconate symporter-like permease